jgi:hypothetical protein
MRLESSGFLDRALQALVKMLLSFGDRQDYHICNRNNLSIGNDAQKKQPQLLRLFMRVRIP